VIPDRWIPFALVMEVRVGEREKGKEGIRNMEDRT
jgi:hypothetical protein